MLTVQVQLYDLDKRLSALENKIKGDNSMWAAVSAMAYKDVINHFKTEENEDGQAWEPWSDWTQGFKRPSWTRPYGIGKGKRGFGAPYATAMLRLTGHMRQSIVHTNQQDYARVMCPIKYAVYHCQPDGGGGKMPKRNFMYLNDEEVQQITNYMQGEILKGL